MWSIQVSNPSNAPPPLRTKIPHPLILRPNLKVKPDQILPERKHQLGGDSGIQNQHFSPQPTSQAQQRLYLLMMFVRSLISRQSLRVAVVAQQSVVEAFAALRRIRDRGTPDDETLVFDAGEVLEGFELGCEVVLVGLGDFGAEFEEDLGGWWCVSFSFCFEYNVSGVW